MFEGLPGSPLSMLIWAVVAIAVIFIGARLLVRKGRKENEEFRESHDEPANKP
jgi:hypothetical protein